MWERGEETSLYDKLAIILKTIKIFNCFSKQVFLANPSKVFLSTFLYDALHKGKKFNKNVIIPDMDELGVANWIKIRHVSCKHLSS